LAQSDSVGRSPGSELFLPSKNARNDEPDTSI